MSLILDALKKSDLERRRDRAPDLQTIHRPPPGLGAAPRRSPWLLGGALLATINLAALGLWWYSQRPPVNAAPPAPAPVVAPAPAAGQVAVAEPPAPQMPEPKAAATLVPAPTQASAPIALPAPGPVPAQAPPARNSPPPRIQEMWEVPESVRNAMPAMTFSFHVYSENPERRTIIINDRRMRQGDSIGDGVVLEEITEDGVILALENHRVHVSVLSDW